MAKSKKEINSRKHPPLLIVFGIVYCCLFVIKYLFINDFFFYNIFNPSPSQLVINHLLDKLKCFLKRFECLVQDEGGLVIQCHMCGHM